MSYLAHECGTCGHVKHHHLGSPASGFENPVAGTGAIKSCTCCGMQGMHDGTRDFDTEPVLRETRAWPSGEPDDLVQPGALWNPDSPAHKMKTCGCNACQAKYAELVA